VNAIRAVQRWTLAFKSASSIAGERDRIWGFLIAAAYLKEAIDSLLRQHYAEIVHFAREDGTPEEVIEKLGDLMSKKPQGLYARLLVNARNKLAFHWEDQMFRRWVQDHSDPTVEWQTRCGTTWTLRSTSTSSSTLFPSSTIRMLLEPNVLRSRRARLRVPIPKTPMNIAPP
jgi:hypothetical protein